MSGWKWAKLTENPQEAVVSVMNGGVMGNTATAEKTRVNRDTTMAKKEELGGENTACLEEDGDDEDEDDDEETPYCDPPAGYVRIRPSQFKGLPATIFFEYPPELGMKRIDISTLQELKSRKLGYSSYWDRQCIRNAFLRAGFKASDHTWTGWATYTYFRI